MKSKRELATRVLRDLKVCNLADAPNPEDAALMNETVDSVLAELNDETLINFDYLAELDTQVIPENVFLCIVDIVRSHGYVDTPQDGALREAGMKRLRRAILQGSDNIPAVVEYF